MTKLLRLEEMIDCLEMMDKADRAANYRLILEQIGQNIADELAGYLGVDCGTAHCEEEAFSGCCTAFSPKFAGQPCPWPLDQFDSEEWDDDAAQAA
jgi:hypothetical protein